MPYISIKAYPKDEEIVNKVTEEINEIFLKYWGCPQEAISVSYEAFTPEVWEEKVMKPEIENCRDKMKIYCGEKMF